MRVTQKHHGIDPEFLSMLFSGDRLFYRLRHLEDILLRDLLPVNMEHVFLRGLDDLSDRTRSFPTAVAFDRDLLFRLNCHIL